MQHLNSIWQESPHLTTCESFFIQKLLFWLTNLTGWSLFLVLSFTLFCLKRRAKSSFIFGRLNTVKSLSVKYHIWLGHPAAKVGWSLTHTVPHMQTRYERDVWVCLGGIHKLDFYFMSTWLDEAGAVLLALQCIFMHAGLNSVPTRRMAVLVICSKSS